MDFQSEVIGYSEEVEAEAAKILRNGEAAPWEAMIIAGRRVRERRKREAAALAIEKIRADHVR